MRDESNGQYVHSDAPMSQQNIRGEDFAWLIPGKRHFVVRKDLVVNSGIYRTNYGPIDIKIPISQLVTALEVLGYKVKKPKVSLQKK